MAGFADLLFGGGRGGSPEPGLQICLWLRTAAPVGGGIVVLVFFRFFVVVLICGSTDRRRRQGAGSAQ